MFITGDIRAWNRLSVVVAFFSLLATGLLVDALRRRLRWRYAGVGFGFALAAVLALGVIDQTNPGALVPYAKDAATYHSDQAFFAGVQGSLPPGASVFQLPYVPFPEGYQPNLEVDQTVPYAFGLGLEYDQARGFINADRLRWSYGAMKGRPADWESQLAAKPLELAVAGAAAAGFDGLVVDLSGYPNADELQSALDRLLGSLPSESPDADFVFYDLRPFARHLAVTQPAARLAALRSAVLTPLRLSCSPGQLTIDNPSGTVKRATLTGSASGALTVGGIAVRPQRGPIKIPMTIAPGTTTLPLASDHGAQLVGPTLVDQAFAPFVHGPASSILSGIVGPPCLNVSTQVGGTAGSQQPPAVTIEQQTPPPAT